MLNDRQFKRGGLPLESWEFCADETRKGFKKVYLRINHKKFTYEGVGMSEEKMEVKGPSMLPPHVQRMELELLQVDGRIRDLLKMWPIHVLENTDALSLERAQYEGMYQYREALAMRIERETSDDYVIDAPPANAKTLEDVAREMGVGL